MALVGLILMAMLLGGGLAFAGIGLHDIVYGGDAASQIERIQRGELVAELVMAQRDYAQALADREALGGYKDYYGTVSIARLDVIAAMDALETHDYNL